MRFERKFKQTWDVAGVKRFFQDRELPQQLRLNDCSMITDLPAMVKSHIEYIDANNGNPLYKTYYTRLRQVKQLLLERDK